LNIYCTGKLTKIVDLAARDDVESSKHHWIANTFKTEKTDWILFLDIATLYSVLIILNDKSENKIQEEFSKAFKAQLKSDSIWSEEHRIGFETAMASFSMYEGYEKSAQAISNNMVLKLKRIFNESKSIDSMRRFATKNLNDVPWKLINFHTARELMILEIQNYR
jgi:hypothetical protein